MISYIMVRILHKFRLLVVFVFVFFVSTSAQSYAAVSIDITSPTNSSSQPASFTVTGTATPNRNISLTSNGNPAGNTISDGLGNWSINLTNQPTGSLTLEATVEEVGKVVVPVSNYEVAIFDLDGNKLVPNIGLDGQAYTVAIAGSKAYVGVDYHCTSYDEFSNCDGDENYGIAIIDLETNSLQGYIHIPSGGITNIPAQLIYSDANNRLYLLGQGNAGGELFVIDSSTDSIITSQAVPLDNIGRYPWLAKMSDDGSRIIVSSGSDRTISIFDTSNNTFGTEFIVCTSVATDIAILPDNSKAYVGCGQDDGIVAFDLTNNTVVATIPTGDRVTRLTKTPDGSRVFVNNDNGNTISVVNPSTDSVVQTIAAQNMNYEFLVNNAGTRLYSLSYQGLGVNETRIETYSINSGSLASLGVTNIGTNWTYVVDGGAIPTADYDPQPNNMDISFDDSRLFIPGNNSTGLTIMNTDDNSFSNFTAGFEARAKGFFVRSGQSTSSVSVTIASQGFNPEDTGAVLAPTGNSTLYYSLFSLILLASGSILLGLRLKIHKN